MKKFNKKDPVKANFVAVAPILVVLFKFAPIFGSIYAGNALRSSSLGQMNFYVTL